MSCCYKFNSAFLSALVALTVLSSQDALGVQTVPLQTNQKAAQKKSNLSVVPPKLRNALLENFNKLNAIEKTQLEPEPVDFERTRAWEGQRWYLIGKFQWPRQIDWLDENSTPLIFSSSGCKNTLEYQDTKIYRIHQKALESTTSGKWIAVEVSPSSYLEELVLKPETDGNCEVRASINYLVNNKRGVQPLLIENPEKSLFGPYEIRFRPVSDADKLGFTYKISTGIWLGSFPNTSGNPKAKGTLGPIGYGLIDWKYLPFYRRLGFSVEYSQNILGKIDGEGLQISDLNFYLWWEYLQLKKFRHAQRVYIGHGTHYGTDIPAAPKIYLDNLRALYPLLGLQIAQYFTNRSYIETTGILAIPNRNSGSTLSQSYWSVSLEIGYYIFREAALLSSFERRNYLIKTKKSESLTCFHAGVKLHF